VPQEQDPFAVLGIPSTKDGAAIEEAYWRRARALAAARIRDPEAAAELEILNEAYRLLMARPVTRPPRRVTARRQWAKRAVTWAMFGAVAFTTALVAYSYRSDLADAKDEGLVRAEEITDDAKEWLESLGKPDTTGAQFYVVGNTAGQGAFLRVAPAYDAAGIVVHPDGAGLAGLGDEAMVGEEKWVRVRDPQGREGWISTRWLIGPPP
jgi:hypothetical protein